MQKILFGTLGFIVMLMFSILLWIMILTPEKTKYGEFTQPFKYWTDDSYFQQNFIGGNNEIHNKG